MKLTHALTMTLTLSLAAPLIGCETKPKVQYKKAAKVEIDNSELDDDPVALAKERQAARENAPEPTLDPKSPRETFELLYKNGKKRIASIQRERYDLLTEMKRVKIGAENQAYKATVSQMISKLEGWTVGRSAATTEKAAAELCSTITSVRGDAERIISEGQAQLTTIDAEIKVNEEKQEAGGTVYQKTWDRLEGERSRWSKPIRAAKFTRMIIKSMLDEAYVLAELGPRRSQLVLRDCLTQVAATPMKLELAQKILDKTIKRAKWYR